VTLLLIAALFAARADELTKSSPEVDVGKRLVAAIKGKAEFHDADFMKPLVDADKAALRRFAACKVSNINHAGTPLPNNVFTVVEDPNQIVIGLDCKRVPYSTPAGISLVFENGKVVKVETHNADLLRVK